MSVAKLPTSDIQPETHAVICGWGNTEKILDPPKHIYKASDNLRMVTVKIISPEECEEKQHFIAVNSSYVCTVTDNSDENASRVRYTFKIDKNINFIIKSLKLLKT